MQKLSATNSSAGNVSSCGPHVRGHARNLDLEMQTLQNEIERIEELRVELANLRGNINPIAYFPAIPGEQIPEQRNYSACKLAGDCTAAQPRLSQDDIANSVDVFTGDDQYNIRSFIYNFEAAALQFAWTDEQQNIYAKRFIGGRLYGFANWLASRTANIGGQQQQQQRGDRSA